MSTWLSVIGEKLFLIVTWFREMVMKQILINERLGEDGRRRKFK
jgi:hypothetical protein